MLDSPGGSLRRQLLLALFVVFALLLSGCGPADDKSSLVQRVSDALIEVGASPSLTGCLTEDLDDHLTEADAKVVYDDLASEPEVSEVALNRVSLLGPSVKKRLLSRVPRCRSLLISQGRFTRAEVDRMLRRVGDRGYRKPYLFLDGSR
jgi:hypothetical protein